MRSGILWMVVMSLLGHFETRIHFVRVRQIRDKASDNLGHGVCLGTFWVVQEKRGFPLSGPSVVQILEGSLEAMRAFMTIVRRRMKLGCRQSAAVHM